jgi:lambda family phage tail tape measure protein
MANMIGRLGVVLGLDSAEFSKGLDGASRRLDKFAEQAITAGKGAALALTAAATASLKYADDIYETAKANDVAIDTIVKMKLALNQSGGAAENASKLMSSFTAFVDKAASGSFEAQKVFQKIGISLKDIGTMSMDTLLAKTISGLNQQEDALTRNAMKMDMFGKASKNVDMLDFADNMAKTNQVTDKQIKGIEQAAKFFDLLGQQAHNTAMSFTGILAPAMTKINELLDGYINKNRSLIDTLHDAYNKFAPGMIKERQPLYLRKRIGGERITPFEIPEDDTEKRSTKVGKNPELEEAKKLLEQRRKYTEDILRDNEKIADKRYQASLKQMDAEAKIMRLEEDHKQLLETNALLYRESERAQSKQLDNEREMFLVATQYKDLKSYELQYAQNVVAIRQKFAEQEYQIKMLVNEQKLSMEEEAIAIQNNNDLRQKSIEQARELLEIQRAEVEGTLTQGVQKGFDEYIKKIPTQLEVGKQAFNSLMGSMESAVEKFTRTGKFSFKDFTKSVIMDMMVIQAKANMMNMIKGFGGVLGGLFSGGGTAFAGVPSGMAMADGGSPPVGLATLVGERGPEMFVPRTAGTVIPNNQLASAMGGGGQTVNYNGPYIASMSAIDTQSGIQFLSKNKQTIWAANQAMARSVPTSR